jgi:uncharacterized protein (UPF0276 family)
MKYLNTRTGTTSIGLAYAPNALEFIDGNPGFVDYLEIPFEQLRHSPTSASIQDAIPVILHCASMSIAGSVPPTDCTLEAIEREAERTRTPWIGEHLAFILAAGLTVDGDTAGPPTSLAYTVCPQMSEETVQRVSENLASLQPRLGAPLILENSPQYFVVPGSTMPMVDFINGVLSCCDVGLLLDLSHFLITMLNTGADATKEIGRLPLERVVEVHISGLNVQSGVVWDDHSTPAPEAVFGLLEQVLERVRPRALTFEYNWSPTFTQETLKAHIDRARQALERV